METVDDDPGLPFLPPEDDLVPGAVVDPLPGRPLLRRAGSEVDVDVQLTVVHFHGETVRLKTNMRYVNSSYQQPQGAWKTRKYLHLGNAAYPATVLEKNEFSEDIAD